MRAARHAGGVSHVSWGRDRASPVWAKRIVSGGGTIGKGRRSRGQNRERVRGPQPEPNRDVVRPDDAASAVPGAAFVGHASRGIYHWVGAPEWSEIPPLERVWFTSEREAQDAGYGPAAPWQPIDELEMLGEIGRGATSIVYHARDRALGRDVAVKVVQTPFGTDPETAARFALEARLLAALRHPNIVSAFAVKALQGGGFALVMEYVRGATLREVIEREGPLPIDRVEQILRDIAAALAAAHGRGSCTAT